MTELKRGEAKRRDLLKAAAELIMVKGAAAATTREIAERAGSTERTLFKQFGSKEGLVTAVTDMVALGQLEQSLFSRLRSDPPQTLDAFEAWNRELLEERIRATGERTEVGRLFLLEIIQNEAFKQRYSGAWIDGLWAPLVRCLTDLQERGEIVRRQRPAFLAQSFLSLQLGYLISRLTVAPRWDWDTARDVAEIAAFFRRSVEPRA